MNATTSWGHNWWPLTLSERSTQVVESFKNHLLDSRPEIDQSASAQASQMLAERMRTSLSETLAKDSLPYLAHVINGWGDGKFEDRRITDHMALFVQRGSKNTHLVKQKDAEGDYHPWQSLAYLVMAGARPDYLIGKTGVTLGELAVGSRVLNIKSTQGEELGHLLFALAWLDPECRGGDFTLNDGTFTAHALADIAIESHHSGPFTVCRKFHLTEGLCAAAVFMPSMRAYRSPAQYFLSGQLDLLLVLGSIMKLLRELRETNSEQTVNDLWQLRSSLVLDRLVENHYYFAGHLLELAVFAAHLGYEVRPEHVYAMRLIANELNALLPRVLATAPFDNSFLHFGHYRRGITLLSDALAAGVTAPPIDEAHLNEYACDFDRVTPRSTDAHAAPGQALIPDILVVSLPEDEKNEFLDAVTELFNKSAPFGLRALGRHIHFRRIISSRWSRGLHYEFFLDDGWLGTEVHLEDDAAAHFRDFVRSLGKGLVPHFPHAQILWDGSWYSDRGRLVVRHRMPVEASFAVESMITLIRQTHAAIDSRIQEEHGQYKIA